jgi:hypothetical protein
MQPLLKMAKYFHEDVRNKAMYALAQLVTAAHAVSPLDAAVRSSSRIRHGSWNSGNRCLK